MIPPPTATGNASAGNSFAPGGGVGLGVGSIGPQGGKKNMPAPQDYQGANAAQTMANRPNQTNAFGVSSTWATGPDGRPTQTTSFGGGLGEASDNLQGQLASATSSPLDFSGLPQLQYGEDARKAAVDAAYGQATSRLDPAWNQREEAERTRLINQGLDPSSEAYRGAMDDFGRGRNDAYTSALNMSIGRGAQDAGQMFGQSATARNMALSELLTGREHPLKMLQGLGGFAGQQGFMGDQSLAAAGMAGQQDWQRYGAEQDQWGDIGGGLGGILGALGKFLPIPGL